VAAFKKYFLSPATGTGSPNGQALRGSGEFKERARALQQQMIRNEGIAGDRAVEHAVLPIRTPAARTPQPAVAAAAKFPLASLELPMTPSRIPNQRRVAQAFGPVLKIARMGAQLSQKELGDRAGMDRATVSQYERGLHEPRLSMILRLSTALGVDAGMLVRMTAGRIRRTTS